MAVGELKLDAPLPELALRFKRRVLIGASTRVGDEERLLRALPALGPNLSLVLAPRRLERVGEVMEAVKANGLSGQLFSQCAEGQVVDVDVLILDRFGILSAFFPAADAAFVGGTFDPRIGGHSPAEAARWGVPLVCGPHKESHAGLWSQIDHRVAEEDLAEALNEALKAPRAPVFGGASTRLAEALEPFLYGPIPPEGPERLLLLPLSWVWTAVTALRNAFWNRRAPNARGCVISVGSLSSGGTGKTALTALLAAEITKTGKQVTVLARGYKREKGPKIRLADERADAAYLGDELAMLAARGIQVLSCPDRVAGAELAFAQGADVVLLDDGFQHRRLARQMDVVLIDGHWPRGGGPMPVGAEREGLKALRRANVIWIQGEQLPEEMAAFLRPGIPHVYGKLEPVCWVDGKALLPLESLAGKKVRAFAGIGRPGRFLASLLALDLEVVEWKAFPDHHVFRPEELDALRAWAEQGLLLTTEKDRVRLPPDLRALALRVEMRPTAGHEAFLEALQRVLAG
jgi:tetraacyldisaccharide 4'-kinase